MDDLTAPPPSQSRAEQQRLRQRARAAEDRRRRRGAVDFVTQDRLAHAGMAHRQCHRDLAAHGGRRGVATGGDRCGRCFGLQWGVHEAHGDVREELAIELFAEPAFAVHGARYEPSSGRREGPRRIWHHAGRFCACWLPRHQRACPSAGLDGAARLPPVRGTVNRFIRMERWI